MKRNGGMWCRVLPLLAVVAAMLPWGLSHGAVAAEMFRNLVVDRTKNLFPPSEKGKGYRFRCPVFGRCNHRIVGMFMVTRRGITEAWVVAAIPNEPDCHACASRMTLEVYRRQGGKWRKYRVWRNFAEWGAWGLVAPEEVRLGMIDDRRMILFLEGGFTNMGQTIESVEIFIIDDEDITPAGHFCLSYDNEGAVMPETGMKLEKWSARYELGSVKGKPGLIFHIDDEVGDDDATVTYEFMGKGLRLRSPGDERLHDPCGG